MIKEVYLNNFRGHTDRTVHFGTKNFISGRNMSGKTTLREAIIFCFTGRDSIGNQAPTHLISRDADKCKVTVVTDKVMLSRSLTNKKSSTIKIQRHGVPEGQTLTQTQLEAFLCEPEVFIAATVPGFFFSMPPNKQHSVLTDILPKISKFELLKELIDFEISEDQSVWLSQQLEERPPNLVATAVASQRIELQKARDEAQGSLNTYQSLEPVPPDPERDFVEVIEKYRTMSEARKIRRQYEDALHAYKRDATTYEEGLAAIDRYKQEAEKLKQQLSELNLYEVQNVSSTIRAEIEKLAAQRRASPPKPAMRDDFEDRPSCVTCGQVIGLKHKERIRAENEIALKEWSAVSKEVSDHNNELQKLIDKSAVKYEEELSKENNILQTNERILAKKRALETQLSLLKTPSIINKPEEPTKPTVNLFTDEEEKDIERQYSNFQTKKAEYNYRKRQRAEAELKVEELSKFTMDSDGRIRRLGALEAGILRTREESFKRQAGHLSFGKYKLIMKDRSVRMVDADNADMPYELFSAGEKTRAEVALCHHFNNVMKRRPGFVFIDNADLVDDLSSITDTPMQLFIALVTNGDFNVEITQ